jgi:hypothetical protein
VAAALAWACASGIDLRFLIQKWINDHLGWQADFWLVSVWLPGQNFGLLDPIVGPVTLVYVLIAMHLHPRRFGWWWYAALTAWAVVRPSMLFIVSASHLARGLGSWWSGAVAAGTWVSGWDLPVCALLLLCADAALLLALTRSRMVGAAALTIAGGWWSAGWLATKLSGSFDNWGIGLPWVWIWHGGLGAAVFWWAVRGRRMAREAWECAACGYDLRGLSCGACPECGAPIAVGGFDEPSP